MVFEILNSMLAYCCSSNNERLLKAVHTMFKLEIATFILNFLKSPFPLMSENNHNIQFMGGKNTPLLFFAVSTTLKNSVDVNKCFRFAT
jgi:hypothetical protein